MAQSTGRSFSTGTVTGLHFLQKYRFLTILQFAEIAGFSPYYTGAILRDLERWGLVGYFGNTGIPGQGKTPKVYFLKRRGWEILCAESLLIEDIPQFTEVHKEVSWTPQMYHRLRTIDLLLSLEIALRHRPHIRMMKVF
jgi:hypothetical protein